MNWWVSLSIAVIICIGAFILHDMMGGGAFKRMVTISGIYAVCKPSGYDAVCFLDADSKEGGMSCLPLATVGGACK